MTARCPTKNKSTKCQEYLHIAPNCSKSDKSLKNAHNASCSSQTKRSKEVKIANCKFIALVDTGSDLTLMRADQYIKNRSTEVK